MRASIKFAREIAKKCFRINEVVNGKEYIAVFDTKLCAQLVEEKFTSTIKQSTQNYACPKCGAVLSVAEYRTGECHSCCSAISA